MKKFADFKEFQTWYNKQGYFTQFKLQRAAGIPVDATDKDKLQKMRAVELGLPATSDLIQILFVHQGGTLSGINCSCENKSVGASNSCYAALFPMHLINTDTERFQNRIDAFSKLSAESVAKSYDPNKFDPVVLWTDPKNSKVYVLAGHSRFEGMSMRGEKKIPARFFQGSEAQAIQYARVESNRAANAENLIEDLQAYKLMRDGDESKGLKKVKKSELNNQFKGKASKLEAWSHLNPNGYFIKLLAEENKSEFPHIESRAVWVGQLRKEHPEITDTQEDDCFNFFYSEPKNLKLDKEEFEKLVKQRLAWGKERLFPECDRESCTDLTDLSERGPQADSYKRLNTLQSYLDTIRERLRTPNPAAKAHTEQERKELTDLADKYEREMKQIRKDLKIVESEATLFGFEYKIPQFDGKEFLINGAAIELDRIEKYELPEIRLSFRKKYMTDRIYKTPGEIAELLRRIWEKDTIDYRESFITLYLSQHNKVLGYFLVGIGNVNYTIADARVILAPALKMPCTTIIISHNHPSGNLEPSNADKQITKNLIQAAKLFSINVYDHLIVTRDSYYSFAENNLI